MRYEGLHAIAAIAARLIRCVVLLLVACNSQHAVCTDLYLATCYRSESGEVKQVRENNLYNNNILYCNTRRVYTCTLGTLLPVLQ